MTKQIVPIGLHVETNMDCDDYGQRITECVRKLSTDSNVVNLIKVDFGEEHVAAYHVSSLMENLHDMFKSMNINNYLFVPVGSKLPIKDIHIEYLEVKSDDINN